LKHEGGWKIHQHPDGSHTWISPTGRHYRENGPPSNPTPASTRPQHSAADLQADSTHLRSSPGQRGQGRGQDGR
jgi:hypothetical protein